MRSISSPATPARSTAAFTTVAPRSVADASASAPCMDPIGVRAIERMTVGSEAWVAMCTAPALAKCCSAHRTCGRLVQGFDALLARRLKESGMTEANLDFELGEMADTIRES